MVYKTFGTCSREINFEVVDNKITNVSFLGGCNGNLQGISKLVEGMDIDEVIARVEGMLTNGAHAVGNNHAGQIAAAFEGHLADMGDAIFHHHLVDARPQLSLRCILSL